MGHGRHRRAPAQVTPGRAPLTGLLEPCGGAPAEWALTVVSGPAGAGEPTLVNRVARAVCDRCPGGLLSTDLRTPAGAPCSPADALTDMLRATGLPGEAVPGPAADRIRLYRVRLHGSRTLVVLDNALRTAGISADAPNTCWTTCATSGSSSATREAREPRPGTGSPCWYGSSSASVRMPACAGTCRRGRGPVRARARGSPERWGFSSSGRGGCAPW